MQEFLNWTKDNLPQYFNNTAILDLGNNLQKQQFKSCRVICCDWEGDVDYITSVNDLEFVNETFNVIIAIDYFDTEKTRENIHDTLNGIARLIKEGGLIILETPELKDTLFFRNLSLPYYRVYQKKDKYVMICVMDGDVEILLDNYHDDNWKLVGY